MPSQERSVLTVRTALRKTGVGVAIVLTAPLWLLARLEALCGRGEAAFTASSELLSLVPGLAGVYLRRGFYRRTLAACADDCHLGFGTTLAHREVQIGRGVYVGNRCTLGQVVLEDHVAVGSNVDLLSGRHQHHFHRPDAPILEQGGTFTPVRVGRNSWIGNGAIVMADVGPDCVIGAGSVVVKPIPARAVAVGNPAAVKKWREPFLTERPGAEGCPRSPREEPGGPAEAAAPSSPH